MTEQEYNPSLVDKMAVDFPRRISPDTAVGNVLSGMMSTARLRGLWGFSWDDNGHLYDYSGQGRTLHRMVAWPLPRVYGVTSYVDFARANSQYFARHTEPGLEVEDYLTLWTWVDFHAQSTGNLTFLLSKWYLAGAVHEYSYALYKDATDQLVFAISTDGVNPVTIDDGGVEYAENNWLFVAGIFQSGTKIELFVGNAKTGTLHEYELVAGIPASIFVSTEAFEVGRGNRSNYLDGCMAYFGMSNWFDSYSAIFNRFHQSRGMFLW